MEKSSQLHVPATLTIQLSSYSEEFYLLGYNAVKSVENQSMFGHQLSSWFLALLNPRP
jgi:hypothetical protein